MNNFVRRTITGAWIVILVMGGFWLHPITFFLAGMVLLVATQYEYHAMIRKTGIRTQVYTGIASGVVAYVLSTLVAMGTIGPEYLLLLVIAAMAIMIAELYRKQDRPFDSVAHTYFAVIYTALPFSMFPFTAFSREGLEPLLGSSGLVFSPGIVIGFFTLLWANDTGAYLAGITLGRNKLFERISPKKTWEGFAGGAVLAAVAGWLLSGLLGVTDTKGWIVVALIISVAGTYGDLVESMLKRSLGVKDSGTIMPGHGGFLDRFDSALLAFPPVCLFLALFGS